MSGQVSAGLFEAPDVCRSFRLILNMDLPQSCCTPPRPVGRCPTDVPCSPERQLPDDYVITCRR